MANREATITLSIYFGYIDLTYYSELIHFYIVRCIRNLEYTMFDFEIVLYIE